MLPAEKTHYRKGLALGLTLAETFSIVVFILLLACAVLLRQQQFQRDAAEAQRDTAQVDLLISREMLRADSMSWGNADAWFDYARQLRGEVDTQRARAEQAESELDRARARASEAESLLAGAGVEAEVAERVVEQAAELDALKDSVAGGEQRLQEAVLRQDSLEQRLAEAEQVGQQVRQQIAERGALTAEEAREVMQQATRAERMGDSLASARNTIETLARELRDTEELLKGDSASVVDSLRTGIAESRFREDTLLGRIRDAVRERNDAVGRAEYRELQLEQLRQGVGIDPPPCWLDAGGNPEYVFRIELTDGGMRLFNIAPGHRARTDPEATRHAAAIQDGHTYPPAEFLRITQPFYSIGVSRTEAFGPMGCRFWIRPVDSTGNRKEVFQERQQQLWRRFWFRW